MVSGHWAQLESDRNPYPKKKYVFHLSSSVIDSWSVEMSWKLGRCSRQRSTSSSSARITFQLSSSGWAHGKLSRGRNGVVGTSEVRTTNHSSTCRTRAPSSRSIDPTLSLKVSATGPAYERAG